MARTPKRFLLPARYDRRLKPCPFCRGPATVEFWHGGAATKRMIACENANYECAVRLMVTGETFRAAVTLWNVRA
jgi:hypothetical protein